MKVAVVFKHPPNCGANSLINFSPNNPNHYPDPGSNGIYIYGLRACVNGQLKFIPLAVGEGHLRARLFNDHYRGKFLKACNNLNSIHPKQVKEKKEIWDLSKEHYTINDLRKLYNDMRVYSNLPRTGRTQFPLLNKIANLNSLLYFQNDNFYNCRYGTFKTSYKNITADQAVSLLTSMENSPAYAKGQSKIKSNRKNLILTLQNLASNFYYVYAEDSLFACRDKRLSTEVATKAALEKIKIFTTADSYRKGSLSLIKSWEFDFSHIQNDLVNMELPLYKDNSNFK